MKLARMSPPYERTEQAYQHLLRYDAQPNVPKEPPHCPVTLFARKNFAHFRTYESFEAIQRFMINGSVFHSNVVVSVDHLREKYRVGQARKLYRLSTGDRFPSETSRDVFQELWDMFQSASIVKMKAKNKSNHGNAYLFKLNDIASCDKKFPKQCRIIMSALVEGQRSSYTLDELKVFANTLSRHGLKTKQPPFRILQYYLPQLHDAGLVEYPRKQYDKEPEEGEE